MITIRLHLKCDQEGIHLHSSGEEKNLNLLEKQLTEGLMKMIKDYFKQAHEQLEANARAGAVAESITGANGSPVQTQEETTPSDGSS